MAGQITGLFYRVITWVDNRFEPKKIYYLALDGRKLAATASEAIFGCDIYYITDTTHASMTNYTRA